MLSAFWNKNIFNLTIKEKPSIAIFLNVISFSLIGIENTSSLKFYQDPLEWASKTNWHSSSALLGHNHCKWNSRKSDLLIWEGFSAKKPFSWISSFCSSSDFIWNKLNYCNSHNGVFFLFLLSKTIIFLKIFSFELYYIFHLFICFTLFLKLLIFVCCLHEDLMNANELAKYIFQFSISITTKN